ncbi:hypothetical protein LCGC14_0246030 [marine sediment metagenome]|uniref:Uncharacterized protein n=1 Tax=marine sediment metagenome TaxID=412755 RepID=A0A0F9UMI4_9ZZZZ
MSKYTFQNILRKQEDGSITGPMSPVSFVKAVAPQIDMIPHGIARWNRDRNSSHTFDHLIVKQAFTNCKRNRGYSCCILVR